MRRIMHILNTGSYSGAENVAITIINAMKGRHECAYVSPEGNIRNVLAENDIYYIPINRMSISEIKSAINTFKPDIIHAHDFTASLTAVLTFSKTPIISHLHNNPPWIKSFNIKTIAYYLGSLKIKRILTVSNAVLDEYIFSSMIRKKSEIISNPINLDAIRNRAKEEICNSSYDVIFLGRLTAQKNPKRFIEIIHKVREKHPNIKACMVGSGELFDSCQQLMQQLNLSNNLELLGFKKNPYTILSNAKIMCITSDWEGFGLVAVEALALGVPALATPVGGLSGIVNSKCGRLCESSEEFIEEILKLLSDEAYWKKKSKEALMRAEQLLNLKEYIDELNTIYNECE